MQHCAVACFVLEQWIVHNCVYVADMYKVESYWKTESLYWELVNLNDFKDDGKPGLSYWILKTVRAVIEVTSS